nr:lipoprotein [Raoultella sp. NCTC 9187]
MPPRLSPRLVALMLLPFSAFAAAKCALTDPSLTLQSYAVNPQQERIAMYWKKRRRQRLGLPAIAAGGYQPRRPGADGDERRDLR